MYFHDHNCSKCKGRKTPFYKATHSNDIQSFIEASEEIRIYNLTESPIVKKPEFLELIIINRAFLVTPLKRPSINKDFKNFNLPK